MAAGASDGEEEEEEEMEVSEDEGSEDEDAESGDGEEEESEEEPLEPKVLPNRSTRAQRIGKVCLPPHIGSVTVRSLRA